MNIYGGNQNEPYKLPYAYLLGFLMLNVTSFCGTVLYFAVYAPVQRRIMASISIDSKKSTLCTSKHLFISLLELPDDMLTSFS